jgi:hypothetical protein
MKGLLLFVVGVCVGTFLEVQPATANLPAGLTHFAIEYGRPASHRLKDAHAEGGRRVDRGDGIRTRVDAAKSDRRLDALVFDALHVY